MFYTIWHRQALAFREAENSPANKKIPQRPNFKDGVSRYNDGVNNIGILRENAKYTIYDYNSKQRTRQLSYTEAREVLENYHEGTGAEAVRAASSVTAEVTNGNMAEPASVTEGVVSSKRAGRNVIDLSNDSELLYSI